MATTLVLADDHAVVRVGLRALIESQPDMQLVGETADGLEVLPLVERLAPQVLILDLMMPGLNGLEIARQVTQRCPRTRVLILSMQGSEGYVIEALRNGAAGYALKGSPAEDLLLAIREVSAGRRYLSPPLTERAIEAYIEKAAGTPLDAYETLSSREREVFQLAAEGRSNAEIGQRLFIGARTVETHRAHLMHKLGLRSQTELVRYALRRGILSLDE